MGAPDINSYTNMIDAGIRFHEAEDRKVRRETEEKQFILLVLKHTIQNRERGKSYNLFLFHIVKNCKSLVREVLN